MMDSRIIYVDSDNSDNIISNNGNLDKENSDNEIFDKEKSDKANPEEIAIFGLSEIELKRYCEPLQGFFVAESPKVISRALKAGYEPCKLLVDEREINKEENKEIFEKIKDVNIYAVSEKLISEFAGYKLIRGMMCLFRRKAPMSLGEFLQQKKRIAVLEDVVNPTNVGAIIRSAAALGMDGVLLTKGCSDPLYRRSARVSMGTVFQIPWTFMDDDISRLKEYGFKTVAMALKNDSVDIEDKRLSEEEKLAIILGTEGEGLKEATIENADYTVMIPMSHQVDSLNVAAASAVTFWVLGKH